MMTATQIELDLGIRTIGRKRHRIVDQIAKDLSDRRRAGFNIGLARQRLKLDLGAICAGGIIGFNNIIEETCQIDAINPLAG